MAHESRLVDEEDAGVGLQVDAGRLLDDFKTLHGDVRLVRETEADEIQHDGRLGDDWAGTGCTKSRDQNFGGVVSRSKCNFLEG